MGYALAAGSGVLLALSFPKFGHPAFAWVALAPLLIALKGAPLRRAFFLGLLAGGIYFTGTLYWITRVMALYGGLATPIAMLVNAALIAYLALFPAVFALVVRRLAVAYGRRAFLAVPFVWAATELGRTYIITGFPWVLLGYSQATVLPIAQFASLAGVYGVSMLVTTTSTALAAFATAAPTTATYTRARPLVLTIVLVVGVAAWGSERLATNTLTASGDTIRVGMVQGNVDQGEKMSLQRSTEIFQDYIDKTRQAIAKGAAFVLWPESSTPFIFEEDHDAANRVREVAREAHAAILVGSDQVERGRPNKWFNSAFLVGPDGIVAGVYRKIHLVPFGEYVPLQKLLFFAAPLTEQVGTFSPGTSAELLPVRGHPVSVSICYEVVYPALVRTFVEAGSELLTTITNDAWFGATSAPYQHFEQASMRAIEEGRYMVRSANTGISGIVDPYGRVLARTAINEPAVVVGDVRFVRTTTFYARHGDVLTYGSALLTAALLVAARRRVQ
ncbi:MAG TPA: apolipoprotein N-acyltransferase [Vicinamibacterales bacterium]